ncbi:MAG: Holliday junction resolvase-like protein [Candidatus Absconditabacterales bacterium]
MSADLGVIIVGIVIGLVLGYLFARIYFLIKMKSSRKAAVSQSRSVTLGYVHEKMAPLLPNFPYHYKDLMFLGKGVDYLVFDGMSAGNLKKIVFLEIKTGVSSLNRNEQMIKNCLEHGNVSYQVRRANIKRL